ncbi:MAG: hypothetical protein ABFC54_05585 [Thermoguttaceae bacterium]
MRTRGVKLLDPVLENDQIDWLLVSVDQCRSIQDEGELISRHFRKPHEPWEPNQAFVQPVEIRRSRRRVLFFQHSGLKLRSSRFS